MESWIFILYLGYNPILLYLFCCSNCSRFGYWDVFQLALGSLWHIPLLCFCLCTSLFNGTAQCFRFILYISFPILRISHFSKDPWFFWIENCIRNQDLGTRCAACYWGMMASRPFKLIKWVNICVYTNPYTCTNLLLFLYITLYIYIMLNISLYWCFQLKCIPHGSLQPPPLDSLWPSTPTVRLLAPIPLPSTYLIIQYTHIVVFELITHTSMGNNFIVLCAVPFAFSLIDSTYFQLLRSAAFPPIPFRKVNTFVI